MEKIEKRVLVVINVFI